LTWNFDINNIVFYLSLFIFREGHNEAEIITFRSFIGSFFLLGCLPSEQERRAALYQAQTEISTKQEDFRPSEPPTFTPAYTATHTYTPTLPPPTNTPEPTFTITKTLIPEGLAYCKNPFCDTYQGPGIDFLQGDAVADDLPLEILGQTKRCEWVEVSSEQSNDVFWIPGRELNFDTPCSQIPTSEGPPTPTPTRTATHPPTNTPSPKISVTIENNTGGFLIVRIGFFPVIYESYGISNGGFRVVYVTAGYHTYTAMGCGTTTSGTINLSSGDVWKFYCD
jgi:hypothetical protein